ncbi:hypothetical protein Prudu_018567 [Prunus dulcis]|uniref:Uncharacterized protein n=1 Tax=Prunus dulcis TaxID=3755 RepID=A0A4Y1RSD0_PRUDU|nr:hypothetical protein Prudu_018567 [Prunus dulcis]
MFVARKAITTGPIQEDGPMRIESDDTRPSQGSRQLSKPSYPKRNDIEPSLEIRDMSVKKERDDTTGHEEKLLQCDSCFVRFNASMAAIDPRSDPFKILPLKSRNSPSQLFKLGRECKESQKFSVFSFASMHPSNDI